MGDLIEDLPHDKYRAIDAVSFSDLKLINRSPALLDWNAKCPVDPEAPKAADLGRAFETKLLEPQRFEEQYAIAPDVDRRTKAGKAEIEEFNEANAGKEILTAEQSRQLEYMVGSAYAHPMSARLLQAPNILVQPSYFFTHPISGLRCKCRPDLLIHQPPILVDVKTTADVSKWRWTLEEHALHMQDALYGDALREYFQQQPYFFFILVSTSRSLGKYPTHVMELHPEDREKGRQTYMQALELYRKCLEQSDFTDVEEVRLPYRRQ